MQNVTAVLVLAVAIVQEKVVLVAVTAANKKRELLGELVT